MIITTIHIDREFSSRGEFFWFIHTYIYTLTVHKKEYFGGACDIRHFHKSIAKGTGEEHAIPLIHCIEDSGLRVIAYGAEAGETLDTWYSLCRKLRHLDGISCQRHVYELPDMGTVTQATQHYVSQSYIPFRTCYKKGLHFVAGKDAKPPYDSETALQIAIKEQMTSFLCALGLEVPDFSCVLKAYPRAYHWREAIKPKQFFNGKKPAFKIEIATDLILPDVFSIGQNVGQGNGVFRRL